MLVRRPKRSKQPQVLFRQFWGTDKRGEILEGLESKQFTKQYEKVAPERIIVFHFVRLMLLEITTLGRA